MSAAKKAPVILIADPDPWSRDLLGQLVLGVRCDARLVLCGDGGEALAHCRRRRFALILAELNLPQVDGFELLREARLRRSVAEQPFILISDRADQASVRAAVALAPTAYLVKPFQAENLMQRLRGLLLKGDEVVACPLPERDAGENLEAFLERARDSAEGAPLLAERAMHFWDLSQRCADIAWELADALGADVERCYTAGLLHRLGDLALLRTLQDWCDGGGALDEARLDELLGRFGASFGSALRARWRLPLELRRLIAAAYQFGGVLSREELILSLATQAASLPEDDAEQLAESKAARMLGLDGERLAKLLQP
ncbi:HDOD domain-containing protein [Pseudomonas aeruginosa]|uniref:HDOD domain-containing protein n=1 Tax=Pseudomonas aeruginosa TaxID=287 RepID=UPI000F546859|nr:HDOD domain-containing protein [Pseudomonas aeruginosa]RQE74017.1 histidine kinase [Pseudomonas aeruginosa]